MPTEKTLTVRVQLLLTPEDAEAIDDWSFANRIRTRSEAIRRLCRMALDAEEKKA